MIIARAAEKLKNGEELTSNAKSNRKQKLFMIRKLVDRAADNGLGKEDYPWIADYALKKIPILRSAAVAGSVSYLFDRSYHTIALAPSEPSLA